MALPATIQPTSPANTDAPSGAAAQIRGVKQILADLLGLPVYPTQITVAPFSITSGGIVTFVVGGTTFTAMIIAEGTITANTPMIDLSSTWNNAAVSFSAIKQNITDTASLATSLHMDLQLAGTSKLKIRKDGSLQPRVLGNLTSGSTAILTAGAAAGTGPTISIVGKDLAGEIVVTTGTTATTGILCDVTFSAPLRAAPTVFVTAANQQTITDANKWFIPASGDANAPTTTKFSIQIGTALTDGTTYKFRYLIVENNA